MAYIDFTDGAGFTELRGLFPGTLVSRFRNWTPVNDSVGDRAVSLATGAIAAAFIYRVDWKVSFELPNISPKGPSGNNSVNQALRLITHASMGGVFTIHVEDEVGTAARAAYAVGPITLTLTDPKLMLYTLNVTAISAVATGPWVAIYGGARE